MQPKKSHRKIYFIGSIVAVIMFGFCFAIVPLYSIICKATGINTSVPGAEVIASDVAADNTVDKTRDITVQFLATNHMGMPWDFSPQVKSVHVHPGEKTKVFFHVRNTTTNNMVAQALPSMTPTDAIAHFHKIECFCFKQQPLAARTSKEMPMVFTIDKDLPKNIRVITLAYTLFDVTPKEETRKG